jgi:hypothetical protein
MQVSWISCFLFLSCLFSAIVLCIAVRCLLSTKRQRLAYIIELVQLQLLMLDILLDDTDIRSLSAYSFFCSHFKMLHIRFVVSVTGLCSFRFHAQQVVSACSCASLEAVLNADAKSVEEHHGKDCQKPCCRHQSKPTIFQLSHSSGQFVFSRTLSSQAGANSGDKEDGLEDGFSDLEVPPEAADKDASLTSEDSSDEDATDESDLPDVKPKDAHMKKFEQTPLLKLMLEVPRNEVTKVLDKFVKDGNTFDRSELYLTILNLRRRKWFGKALEVCNLSMRQIFSHYGVNLFICSLLWQLSCKLVLCIAS